MSILRIGVLMSRTMQTPGRIETVSFSAGTLPEGQAVGSLQLTSVEHATAVGTGAKQVPGQHLMPVSKRLSLFVMSCPFTTKWNSLTLVSLKTTLSPLTS